MQIERGRIIGETEAMRIRDNFLFGLLIPLRLVLS